ncbi:hypothetical protein [Brevifollis gellanilyticus]|uniref:Uncharacterized protein n=1 Tax=Brevifollis gellanilyticus TaxID=748831 RepID=A0A512M916_9BACT|nr:hypothetical protein [Brevifollis gellanilyticus]GEP43236.1 hypothetical protein BGE01nite_25270 [Brevifollis gellanilyticus]
MSSAFGSEILPRRLLGCLVPLILVAVIILGGRYWTFEDRDSAPPSEASSIQTGKPPGQTAPLPGEQILASYGKPDTRPEEDLSMMAHAFSNLTLLIKGDAPFRMGANEEFAAALRGKNRDRLRLLPDTHPCFNAQGQIVDRWATPLFFHVNDRDHIDIRSAGPDKEMGTPDDLHRRYDGQFLHGEALNSRSLDEAGRSPMAR